jgi:hypothetical protein
MYVQQTIIDFLVHLLRLNIVGAYVSGRNWIRICFGDFPRLDLVSAIGNTETNPDSAAMKMTKMNKQT